MYLNGAILGMSRREIDRRFDEIVEFSGVERFLDTPIKRYSSGMYLRLAFAVAAHLDADILLVDEVLAVGDAEFQTSLSWARWPAVDLLPRDEPFTIEVSFEVRERVRGSTLSVYVQTLGGVRVIDEAWSDRAVRSARVDSPPG